MTKRADCHGRLVREWLDQKARVAAELASTREASERSAVSSSVPAAVAAPSGLDLRTVGIMGILLLGILYTLYFARAFLLPEATIVDVEERRPGAGLWEAVVASPVYLTLAASRCCVQSSRFTFSRFHASRFTLDRCNSWRK